MKYVLFMSIVFICFLAGIYFICAGWKKYKEEPERFQFWHIHTSGTNRNHGINFIIFGLMEIVISIFLVYALFY